MTLREFCTNIANALRSYTDIRTKIKAKEFPSLIERVHNTGYDTGYGDGYHKGYDFGSYEAAQMAMETAYNDFWDVYQQQGNREHYSYAFGGKGWTDKTFKPKYDIIIGKTVGTCLFAYSQICDLKGILKKQGVVLDTSQCTDIGSIFNTCTNLIRAPQVNASNSKHCGSMFYNCTQLEEIDLIIKDDGSQTFGNTFTYCNKLYDLKITGVIGQTVNLKWSKNLSKQSVINVINALSSSASGMSLTLSQEVKWWFNNTDWNNLINKKKNWTISLV